MTLPVVGIVCLTILVLASLVVGLIFGLKKDPRLIQIQEMRRVVERRRVNALNLADSYLDEKSQHGLSILKECDDVLIQLAKHEAEIAEMVGKTSKKGR